MGISKYKTYSSGEYYHIYNRGNRKQKIFLENKDYIYYLEKLRSAKEKHNVTIIFYCLMPNHIHLIVRQNSENPISKFIASLHTSYSMYFNKKYDRVGHLFQGRFKKKDIKKDEYLLYLSYYVHLNPWLDDLVKKIEDYQWSSYRDYVGLREGTLCEKDMILQGQSFEEYKRSINDIKEYILENKKIRDHIKDCP